VPESSRKLPFEQIKIKEMRKIFVVILGCTFLLLIGYAGYLSYSKAKESRLMAMSRSFMNQGEWRKARLDLSEVLHIDPRNVEATRMMADLASRDPVPGELSWRKRVVELDPGSAKDLTALAMAAVKAGDLALATNSLAQVVAADQKNAEYQNAVGVVAIAEHEPALAEASFQAATTLDPTNEVPRLNLAVLRLHSTNQISVAQARQELTSLADGPDRNFHCQALRELIADAFVHERFNSAFDLSRRLLAEPDARFSDRILQLSILQQIRSPELPSALAATQAAAGQDTARINELAQWEMKNRSPQETLGWINRLPGAIQTNQPVAMLAAECRLVQRDWPGLDESLRTQNWGALEFVRHAMRARALFGEQQIAGKTAEWDEARQTAGTGIKNLTVLLELSTQWNWPVEKTDLLSSILKHHPEAKWAVPLLVNELAASGRTRALMTLFQQQVDQDPSDLQAKNNLAMTALLLNAVELRPFELARQVYEMEPTNISYASTYAFSLYQQKKWAEALNAFAPFDSKTLANPEVAGYYGLALQANGHPRQAKEYLDRAAHSQRLLPEERNLFIGAP
jgi:Flp pilus assembly protein TadD